MIWSNSRTQSFELVRDSLHGLWLFNMKGILAKASRELTRPSKVEEEAFLQRVLTRSGICFGSEVPYVPRKEPASLMNVNGVQVVSSPPPTLIQAAALTTAWTGGVGVGHAQSMGVGEP